VAPVRAAGLFDVTTLEMLKTLSCNASDYFFFFFQIQYLLWFQSFQCFVCFWVPSNSLLSLYWPLCFMQWCKRIFCFQSKTVLPF